MIIQPIARTFSRRPLREIERHGPRQRTQSRRRNQLTLTGIETLEPRCLLAVNLTGAFFDVQPAARAGDTIFAEYQIANTGFDTVFSSIDVRYFITRGPVLSPLTSAPLADRFLPPGFPGFFTLDLSAQALVLPPPNNPFWSGNGTYTIGMVIDPDNFIFESNEFDNANQGPRIDLDTIEITGTDGSSSNGPDLVGAGLNVTTSVASPGGSLHVDYAITNPGALAAGAFGVAIFMSPDPIITSDDRAIGSELISGLATGPAATLHHTIIANLPPATDPIWNGLQRVWIGMIIDTGDSVAETNELNNSNQGLGIDLTSVLVGASGAPDFDHLPPTGHRPGILFKGDLDKSRAILDQTLKNYDAMRAAAKGIVNLPSITGEINQLGKSMAAVSQRVGGVISGRSVGIPLNSNSVLDRHELDLIDRYLYQTFTSLRASAHTQAEALPVAAGPLAAGDGGRVRTLDADDEWLKSVLNPISKWPSDFAKELAPALDRFKNNVNTLLGQGTAAAHWAGSKITQLKDGLISSINQGAKSILGEKTEGDQRTFFEKAREAILDRARDQAQEEVLKEVPEAKEVSDEVNALKALGKKISDAFSLVEPFYDAIVTRIRGGGDHKPPGGGGGSTNEEFKGLDESPVTLSDGRQFDGGGPMNLKLSLSRRGTVTGSLNSSFVVIDPTTFRIVGRSKTTASFRGSVDGDMIRGTITLHGGNGLTKTTTFTWKMEGKNLTGALYEGSPTTFNLRRNK